MNAIKIGNQVSIVFTTVLDELPLGLVDEDEEIQEVTDQAYWERRGTKATVGMADEFLEIIKAFDSELELKYNKFYIGLAKMVNRIILSCSARRKIVFGLNRASNVKMKWKKS